MSGENRLLLIDELVDFEKLAVEIQDVGKVLIILKEFRDYNSNQ